MDFDYLPMPEEILGEQNITCSTCNTPIDFRHSRQRCVHCANDYCETCQPCQIQHHEVIPLNGFPELTDSLDELANKSKDIFAELETQFHVPTNIYFIIASKIAPLLQMKAHGLPLDGVAENLKQWLDNEGEAVLRRYISLKSMGRYVDYFDRRSFFSLSANSVTMASSQGTIAPIKWKGLPMMRTVWDFALIPVFIQEIKPKTIIEFGTAAGGAACYYASMMEDHGIEPNVHTMDLFPPDLKINGVTFHKGNANAPEETFTKELLESLPKPWLVIEDAHINIEGICRYLHDFMTKGDYLFIEDYDAELAIHNWFKDCPDEYMVDTRYTDYFGYNNTCSRDQIFCKVK